MSLEDAGFPDLPKWDLFHFFRDDEDRLRLDKQMIIHSVEQLLDAFRKVFILRKQINFLAPVFISSLRIKFRTYIQSLKSEK